LLTPKKSKPCLDCGVSIFGWANKKWCHGCRRKRARASAVAKHGKVSKHRHRARRYGVAYEPINPIEIFNRDKWRCQICGCKTPRQHRGTIKVNAPELDHRVPMSKGGAHTRNNVQTACRGCNSRKGDKISPVTAIGFAVAEWTAGLKRAQNQAARFEKSMRLARQNLGADL